MSLLQNSTHHNWSTFVLYTSNKKYLVYTYECSTSVRRNVWPEITYEFCCWYILPYVTSLLKSEFRNPETKQNMHTAVSIRIPGIYTKLLLYTSSYILRTKSYLFWEFGITWESWSHKSVSQSTWPLLSETKPRPGDDQRSNIEHPHPRRMNRPARRQERERPSWKPLRTSDSSVGNINISQIPISLSRSCGETIFLIYSICLILIVFHARHITYSAHLAWLLLF